MLDYAICLISGKQYIIPDQPLEVDLLATQDQDINVDGYR